MYNSKNKNFRLSLWYFIRKIGNSYQLTRYSRRYAITCNNRQEKRVNAVPIVFRELAFENRNHKKFSNKHHSSYSNVTVPSKEYEGLWSHRILLFTQKLLLLAHILYINMIAVSVLMSTLRVECKPINTSLHENFLLTYILTRIITNVDDHKY